MDTGAGKDAEGHTLPDPAGRRTRGGRGPAAAAVVPVPARRRRAAGRGAASCRGTPNRDYAVGEFAREFGSQVPTRLVAVAKSWLCHPGVDRKAPILPFRAPGRPARKVSPLEATHPLPEAHRRGVEPHASRRTWPANRLEAQDIVLTVPASFDAAARELTVEAARAAGFENLTLLEEPQAAFYAWLDRAGDDWRKQVDVGDLVLVADVGGGTTDFTLIEVGEEGGNLALTRLAVGDHILLGGDNMDLALAHHAAQALAAKGTKLDAGQMLQLTHACRNAKEELFADAEAGDGPGHGAGQGPVDRRRHDQGRADAGRRREGAGRRLLPRLPADAEPAPAAHGGLAGTRPALRRPTRRHAAPRVVPRRAGRGAGQPRAARRRRRSGARTRPACPTAVLFNGGVFKADALRNRLLGVLGAWAKAAKADAAARAARRRPRPRGGPRGARTTAWCGAARACASAAARPGRTTSASRRACPRCRASPRR